MVNVSISQYQPKYIPLWEMTVWDKVSLRNKMTRKWSAEPSGKYKNKPTIRLSLRIQNGYNRKRHPKRQARGEPGALRHCWGQCNGGATLKNSLVVPPKVKHKVTTWPSNPAPGYIPKRTENLCLHIKLYTTVHSIITHNSQRGETKCPSNDEQISQSQRTTFCIIPFVGNVQNSS